MNAWLHIGHSILTRWRSAIRLASAASIMGSSWLIKQVFYEASATIVILWAFSHFSSGLLLRPPAQLLCCSAVICDARALPPILPPRLPEAQWRHHFLQVYRMPISGFRQWQCALYGQWHCRSRQQVFCALRVVLPAFAAKRWPLIRRTTSIRSCKLELGQRRPTNARRSPARISSRWFVLPYALPVHRCQ